MYIILGIITSFCFLMCKSINMLLAKETGIFSSNFINHLTGLTGSILVFFISLIFIPLKQISISSIPFYGYLGGVLGASFVILSNYTFSKTSVITSSILILAGQFLSSLLFGLNSINLTKITGAALIILSIILYSTEKNEG